MEEAPGFVVNRILIPMINEAVGILADGVAEAEDIDKAMKLGANFPMGPLALGDLIGLDVCSPSWKPFTGNTAKTSTVRTYICARWSATASWGERPEKDSSSIKNLD